VADLSLQLYDGLVQQNLLETATSERSRAILRVAALMRAVGASGRGKKPQRKAYRMISALQAPIGWASEDFKMTALLVRYHRGALPAQRSKEIQGLSVQQQKLTIILAGVLRLAAVFGRSRPTRISSLEVQRSGQTVVIRARGFHKYDPLAQKLARARYLLEIACGLPVIIRSR
jgi:exopolyphosphatase/pppGpp-phosphohydrolase